jgi:NAD(P)-dependent dehydrogenase (short-subunit alcohol dehydrogenase family)
MAPVSVRPARAVSARGRKDEAPPPGAGVSETQVGTNHLGHFALTGLLLPQVTDRVVSVASGAHRLGRIDLGDLNWERRRYRRWPAYGQSTLANLRFVLEPQRRLADALRRHAGPAGRDVHRAPRRPSGCGSCPSG